MVYISLMVGNDEKQESEDRRQKTEEKKSVKAVLRLIPSDFCILYSDFFFIS